jgi:hypothetical protein
MAAAYQMANKVAAQASLRMVNLNACAAFS